jgi:MFS family permease
MWRVRAPLWGWAIASVLIGLGFTFFSGATEAWLVDALRFSGFTGNLESVFAKGQAVAGAAMLVGSLTGGFVAQLTNLGVPYILRSALLGLTLIAAFLWMKDLGFTPGRSRGPAEEVRRLWRASLEHGWHNPPVRWLMLAAPFTMGVVIFGFYALQPYLLDLYGDEKAFAIAGLAAAIIAGTEIAGGLLVPSLRRVFRRRTHVLILTTLIGIVCLAIIGWTASFWVAIGALLFWGLSFAISIPVRQAYLNGLIPSAQRATVLSFDNLMGSAGGVVAQPALGRVADVVGYPSSYVAGAIIQLLALPFLVLARRQNADSDRIDTAQAETSSAHP